VKPAAKLRQYDQKQDESGERTDSLSRMSNKGNMKTQQQQLKIVRVVERGTSTYASNRGRVGEKKKPSYGILFLSRCRNFQGRGVS